MSSTMFVKSICGSNVSLSLFVCLFVCLFVLFGLKGEKRGKEGKRERGRGERGKKLIIEKREITGSKRNKKKMKETKTQNTKRIGLY